MTVKTTLSFTDRHHRYLAEKVGQGVFATRSAAVAAAIEQMMRDETERNVALLALPATKNERESDCPLLAPNSSIWCPVAKTAHAERLNASFLVGLRRST